jgi:hypothetical protein
MDCDSEGAPDAPEVTELASLSDISASVLAWLWCSDS